MLFCRQLYRVEGIWRATRGEREHLVVRNRSLPLYNQGPQQVPPAMEEAPVQQEDEEEMEEDDSAREQLEVHPVNNDFEPIIEVRS